MTREELGSYLGLKLETVSRLLSKLQQEGLIRVESKSVKLLDLAALRLLEGRETLDA
jgi:CRP/FNR family transcriptional regulator